MPKFQANMNYIPPSPPSSMKQCNKSATVKFHMELLLTTTTRKQSRSGATPYRVEYAADLLKTEVGQSNGKKYPLPKVGLPMCKSKVLSSVIIRLISETVLIRIFFFCKLKYQ